MRNSSKKDRDNTVGRVLCLFMIGCFIFASGGFLGYGIADRQTVKVQDNNTALLERIKSLEVASGQAYRLSISSIVLIAIFYVVVACISISSTMAQRQAMSRDRLETCH